MPSPPNPASNPHRRPGRQSSSTRPSPTGSAGTSGNRPTPPGNRQRLDRGPGTHLWSQALTPPPRPADSPDAPPPGPTGPGRMRTGHRGTEHPGDTMKPTLWSTPGLVETRFSPDALVWVAVVFHG